MEAAMRVRLTLIAIFAGSASAEPPNDVQPAPGKPAKASVEIVLASADSAHAPTPASAQPTPTPPKRRVARVTSCRCGDPAVGPDSQEQ
jgi:hypothetical protein